METGDHGLATVNVTLLVVEETNKEHVSAKEQHMVVYPVCYQMEVVWEVHLNLKITDVETLVVQVRYS